MALKKLKKNFLSIKFCFQPSKLFHSHLFHLNIYIFSRFELQLYLDIILL